MFWKKKHEVFFIKKSKPSNIWSVKAVCWHLCAMYSWELWNMALLSVHWNNVQFLKFIKLEIAKHAKVGVSRPAPQKFLSGAYFQVYCLPVWSAQEQLQIYGCFHFAAIIFLFWYKIANCGIQTACTNQLLAGDFHKHMASDR